MATASNAGLWTITIDPAEEWDKRSGSAVFPLITAFGEGSHDLLALRQASLTNDTVATTDAKKGIQGPE